MEKDTIKFGNKILKKDDFDRGEIKLFNIEEIGLDKVKRSIKKRYGQRKGSFKYHIGYDDNDDIFLLIIKLSEMIRYCNHFYDGKTMNFRCDDKNI